MGSSQHSRNLPYRRCNFCSDSTFIFGIVIGEINYTSAAPTPGQTPTPETGDVIDE